MIEVRIHPFGDRGMSAHFFANPSSRWDILLENDKNDEKSGAPQIHPSGTNLYQIDISLGAININLMAEKSVDHQSQNN